MTKSVRAAKKYKPRNFLVVGGVAANTRLREMFRVNFRNDSAGITLHVPELKYCTDNAAMVAVAAYYLPRKTNIIEIKVNPALSTTD